MAAARPFADMLARFLTVDLAVTRDCSRNTISAYRDAFTLFLRFMEDRLATPPDRARTWPCCAGVRDGADARIVRPRVCFWVWIWRPGGPIRLR